MSKLSVEEFEGKIDSLYRLVIVAGRRANQLAKPEVRPLVPVRSRKPTMVALQEILDGKVTWRVDNDDEGEYVE